MIHITVLEEAYLAKTALLLTFLDAGPTIEYPVKRHVWLVDVGLEFVVLVLGGGVEESRSRSIVFDLHIRLVDTAISHADFRNYFLYWIYVYLIFLFSSILVFGHHVIIRGLGCISIERFLQAEVFVKRCEGLVLHVWFVSAKIGLHVFVLLEKSFIRQRIPIERRIMQSSFIKFLRLINWIEIVIVYDRVEVILRSGAHVLTLGVVNIGIVICWIQVVLLSRTIVPWLLYLLSFMELILGSARWLKFVHIKYL